MLGGALVGSVLSARLLGPSGRGELAAAVVWIGLLLALADFGIPQSLTYHVARQPEAAPRIVGTALALAVVLGLALTAVGRAALLPLLERRGAATEALGWYLLCLPFSLCSTYCSTAFQGLGQFRIYNLIRLAQTGSYVAALALVAGLGMHEAKYVVWSMTAIQAAAAVAGLVMMRTLLPLHAWRADRSTLRMLLTYGIKSYPGNLAWLANGKLDQMFISLYMPAEALGVYAVSVSYGSILFGLSGSFASVAFHRVAAAAEPVAARRTLRQLVSWNFALTVPLGAAMIAAAPVLIPLAFGTSFVQAVRTATILVVSGALLGFNYVLSSGLRGLGRPLAPSRSEAIGLILNVAAMLYLVPRYGIVGAACAACCGYLTTFSMLLWHLLRARRPATAARPKRGDRA